MQNHILSIILFTPLVGAILLLFVPKENKDAIRWIANIFALGGFLISVPLVPLFWDKSARDPGPSNSSRARPTTGFPPSGQGMCSASTAFRSCSSC